MERDLARLRAALRADPQDAALQAKVAHTAARLEQFRSRRSTTAFEVVPADLDALEEEQLRGAFRDALRICHPDAVAPHLKARADQICRALVSAYRMKNLLAVEDILLQLRTEGVSGAEVVSEGARELLLARRETLAARKSVEAELLAELSVSKAYLRAVGIEDWDAYFAAARASLEARLVDAE